MHGIIASVIFAVKQFLLIFLTSAWAQKTLSKPNHENIKSIQRAIKWKKTIQKFPALTYSTIRRATGRQWQRPVSRASTRGRSIGGSTFARIRRTERLLSGRK